MTKARLKQPSAAPTRKLLAYTASGATLGPAITTLVVWMFETIARQPMPSTVQGAILTLCVLGFGFLAAYQTPASADDVPVVDTTP